MLRHKKLLNDPLDLAYFGTVAPKEMCYGMPSLFSFMAVK